MADLKPPRVAGDERAVLRALLQYQRDSVVRKTEGVDDEDARRALVPTGTSLVWLVRHLAAAEVTWVVNRFAGLGQPTPDAAVNDGSTLADAVDLYRSTWQAVDRIVAAEPSLDAMCRAPDVEPNVDLRWVLAHLLEETARHAGHADIIRELLDGATGR